MYVPARNVSDSPVVIDFQGRILAGGDWGVVDRSDPAVESAVDRNVIVLAPSLRADVDDIDPDAADAVRAAGELEDRRKAFDRHGTADLRRYAAGIEGFAGAEDLEAAQLVRALARHPSADASAVEATPEPGDADDVEAPTIPPPARPRGTTRKAAG